MLSVKNMKVIVTGGSSGIGRATAEMLSRLGAIVMIADINQARADAAVKDIQDKTGGQLVGFGMDVRKADDCERMMTFAEEQLGEIDGVVHSAGILRIPGSRPRPVYEVEEEEYDAVVGTNLKGTFLVNRAALKVFMSRKRGQIINLSSVSGRKGRPLDGVYSASKAGVIGLSEAIAEEVRSFGIRVMVIMPDAVDTPLWSQNGPINEAPPGAMPAERVAEVIAMCLSLSPDVFCENLVVAPMRTRMRRQG